MTSGEKDEVREKNAINRIATRAGINSRSRRNSLDHWARAARICKLVVGRGGGGMNPWVGVGVAVRALLPVRAVGSIDPSNVRRRLIVLALAGVVFGLFFASKSTAQADETVAGASYSALRNYIQKISAEDIQPVGVLKTGEGDAFAALRDFARGLSRWPVHRDQVRPSQSGRRQCFRCAARISSKAKRRSVEPGAR